MIREMICVTCPKGCSLRVEDGADGSVTVTGNACPRGRRYGEQELRDPRRVVTAVAPVASDRTPFLPVKTDRPVPLKKIPGVLTRIYALRLTPPVSAGAVLIADCDGGGANVIATDSVPDGRNKSLHPDG